MLSNCSSAGLRGDQLVQGTWAQTLAPLTHPYPLVQGVAEHSPTALLCSVRCKEDPVTHRPALSEQLSL